MRERRRKKEKVRTLKRRKQRRGEGRSGERTREESEVGRILGEDRSIEGDERK